MRLPLASGCTAFEAPQPHKSPQTTLNCKETQGITRKIDLILAQTPRRPRERRFKSFERPIAEEGMASMRTCSTPIASKLPKNIFKRFVRYPFGLLRVPLGPTLILPGSWLLCNALEKLRIASDLSSGAGQAAGWSHLRWVGPVEMAISSNQRQQKPENHEKDHAKR